MNVILNKNLIYVYFYNPAQSKYTLQEFDKNLVLKKQKYKGKTIPYDLQYN